MTVSSVLALDTYGKSLIFENLAVLGGPKKLVIVISPLKALERDQVLKLVLFQIIYTFNLCFHVEHATVSCQF